MSTAIKICGLNDEASVGAVIKAAVDYAGFVYYPKSPRHIKLSQMAKLRKLLPNSIKSVVVLVNPSNETLAEIAREVSPDFFQLHGKEKLERVLEIRKSFPQIGIIKAIAVRNAEDIEQAEKFSAVADALLFDAKPPIRPNMLPGGNGITFDWSLLANKSFSCKWFLSGGLNAENVTEAIRKTSAKMIDVSSGVESYAGVKYTKLIDEFVKVARK